MGWAVGYDSRWKRDIGYGIPAVCDHPDCGEDIDRGLSYVCGSNPRGGEHGCGLYFCDAHLGWIDVPWPRDEGYAFCERCSEAVAALGDVASDDHDLNVTPFDPTLDTQEWMMWKLTDESWQKWRDENPEEVDFLRHNLSLLVL